MAGSLASIKVAAASSRLGKYDEDNDYCLLGQNLNMLSQALTY